MDSAQEYEALINTDGKSEGKLQTFLEQHSELIPASPFELGHGIRLDSFITKFQLDTTLITDFTYLTKDSGTWRVVLIEIEPADISLFTSDVDSPQPTADFTKRLTQIDKWKAFVKDHPDVVKKHLKPLMNAFPRETDGYDFEFRFMLVVGRRSMLKSEALKKLFAMKSDSTTKVITHDTLISWHLESPQKRRNILRAEGNHFTYKYLTCPCLHTFDTATSIDLTLDDKHAKRLEKHGFEIEKWKRGQKLDSLGKATQPKGVNGAKVADIVALHKALADDPEGV